MGNEQEKAELKKLLEVLVDNKVTTPLPGGVSGEILLWLVHRIETAEEKIAALEHVVRRLNELKQ